MRRLICIIGLIAIPNLCLFGQGKTMVVGTLVNRPHAILVLNPPNADQGFLLPQLSTSERMAVVPNSPQEDGLIVFDTSEKMFYYWNNNAWVRGLGDAQINQSLSYDPSTQILSLTNGGQVNLSPLQEIPSITSNAGKFLTNDGTTLSWVTVSSIGDVTGIIAGQGLSGGGTDSDINLSVNTDGTTIDVNGSNALQVVDGGITSSKIAPGAVGTSHIASGGNDKILTTDGVGAVTWIDRSTLVDDNQTLSLTGNTLDIEDGNNVDLSTVTASGNVAGPLSNLAIQNNAVTSAHIADNSVGATELADNAVDQNAVQANAITSTQLADNAVDAAAIQAGVVNTTHLVSGGNDKVLTTSAGGVVTWADRTDFVDDNQNLSLTGNNLNIEDGAGVNLSAVVAAGQVAGPLSALVIQPETITDAELADNSVDAAALQAGSINTTHIQSTGNDKVLTTTSGGVVFWADRSTFTDNQNLGLTGNTLNIDDGASVDLSLLVAAGQVAGALSNLMIQPDVITAVELADNAVDGSAIQTGVVNTTHLASGGNNKVLTTSGTGVVGWADRSDFADDQNLGLAGNQLTIDDGVGVDLSSLSVSGQIAGTLNNVVLVANAVTDVELADNAVDASAIQSGVVNTTHITSGGNDKVLTTTAGGVVTWTDRSTFTDGQDLSLSGNTLNITGGTGADLSTLAASGQVAGPLNNLEVQADAIDATHIATDAVGSAEIATDAVGAAELANNAVDGAAIQNGVVNTNHIVSGGNDKVLTTTAGGNVTWADRSTFTDAQNLGLTGNTLNITNGTGVDLNAITAAGQVAGALDNLAIQNNAVTSSHIADDAVGSTEIAADAVGSTEIAANAVGADEIADDAVDGAAIQDNVVNTNHLVSGGNDKVLTTTAGGNVAWADRATFTDGQNLGLTGNTLNITNGTGVDLNAIAAAGQVAGALDNLAIQNNAVTSSHIADDAVGSTEIAADAVGSAEIAANAVGADEIADDAVDGAAIQDGVVNTNHLVSGGNDKVLTTTAGGNVAWADRATFTDGQNLGLTGNTLNITNGTGVDLNAVTASGQVAGTLDNLAIQNNAVTSSHIADDAVGSTEIAADAVGSAEIAANAVGADEIADDAVDGAAIQDGVVNTNHVVSGGNNKVLTTTAGGAVAWADRSTFTDAQNLSLTGNTMNISNGTGVSLDGVTHSGDVTGTVAASTVAKIQGRDVANVNPNTNDLLMWNGTAWVPQAVSVVAPTVQYYAVDPSAFVGLEPTNGSNQTILGLYQDDNTFVAANGEGRQIMAPVNLPHGATINRITVYYSDLDLLGDFTIAFHRKQLGGGNETLASRSTLLVTIGVANFDLPAIAAANRVVDNSTYSYRIHVTFSASGQGPALLDQRLYGIRIEYTK